MIHRPPIRSRRVAPIIGDACLYALLLLLGALTLVPLLWSLAASFTPLGEIDKNAVPFSWKAFFPTDFTLHAYQEVLAGQFPDALATTLFVCAVTVLGGIAVNSLAGFAFAMFDFPGKQILFVLVLITFLLPFEALALPLYVIVNALHLTNSYQALILPVLANGIVIFLFRQFFLDTPRELLDAARVDGLTWFGVYLRIVVPLSTPVMVSASLILFLSQWQSFFYPLLVANDPRYQMVQVAVGYMTQWNEIFAVSVITTIVPVLLIVILQRYYMATISRIGLIE